MSRKTIASGVLLLFLISAVSPLTMGISLQEKPTVPLVQSSGPMEHQWTTHGHDVHHSGLSPYSSIANSSVEKWRFDANDHVGQSPVIDRNGTIYFASSDGYVYAVYPNGTMKWKSWIRFVISVFGSSPAIDENGVVYVGNCYIGEGLYAINPDGSRKWYYKTGSGVHSSPVIGEDGAIFFSNGPHMRALYPNGTLKWSFTTGVAIHSSPAIGLDGTLYFGSHDDYFYALNASDGSLIWKYKTGNWVHGSPSIGNDGTVFVGSDDKYLYAFYPNNGTVKWRTHVGSMLASPSIDKDGILYFGVWENRFRAVYPNGTIKWSYTLDDRDGIWGSTAAISDDGTIFIGVCIDIWDGTGGKILALNSDGSLKWEKQIANHVVTSSPCIGENGVVYIGSSTTINGNDYGYLHAFAPIEGNQPPSTPIILGENNGIVGEVYSFRFNSTDPEGFPVRYYVDWGDGEKLWTWEYPSGKEYKRYHSWSKQGTYEIRVKAMDISNAESDWGTMEVTMPLTHTYNYPAIHWLIERFPLLSRLLNLWGGLE